MNRIGLCSRSYMLLNAVKWFGSEKKKLGRKNAFRYTRIELQIEMYQM